MHQVSTRSFLVADAKLRALMLDSGRRVHTETWQGVDIRNRPDAETTELLNVSLETNLRGIMELDHWRAEVRPNLPWADDHFAERVSRQPLNPPPSWAWWPWASSAAKHRTDTKFNHTYPERFWPKFAGDNPDLPRLRELGYAEPLTGIRFEYGDLDDVVALLKAQPLTRQAYLPIFFPEDTGIGDGGRKPCTLGYHFILRDGALHCTYPMRSTDLVRHLRDDIYLAIRLMLWVREQCSEDRPWDTVRLGTLTMHMTSLHCFANDMITLRQERDAMIARGLA